MTIVAWRRSNRELLRCRSCAGRDTAFRPPHRRQALTDVAGGALHLPSRSEAFLLLEQTFDST